ncbi:MAG: hypothetical protein GYB49_05840 [Alphaproteobacteria bacterium]|nr:hypothetical protein [Hyphomonas sp.]MBR9806727.1 hypothetical protein [Alphaproteobacteria bacterium]|tara:strand:+ start:1213 stop:2877 length:1665 start_codon:yes stop_codon:yes gene_type:complete
MINLDMFHVDLGASILMRFQDSAQRPINILADAGVHGGSFAHDYILQKLRSALNAGEDDPIRLNLLIGTHYDADHLNRMVAIIESDQVSIDEAWMPPVADDTEETLPEWPLEDSNLLAIKFAREFDANPEQERQSTLERYLAEYKRRVLDIRRVADDLQAAIETGDGDIHLFAGDHQMAEREAGRRPWDDLSPDQFFLQEIADIDETLRERDVSVPLDHAAFTVTEEFLIRYEPLDEGIAGFLDPVRDEDALEYLAWRIRNRTPIRLGFEPIIGTIQPTAALTRLDLLRKSYAKNAINATQLNKVVVALKKKKVPVFARSIQDGVPRRFVWHEASGRLVGSKNDAGDGLELMLLAPSNGLIEKHREKLPVARQIAFALYKTVPLKSITESNQLSYVIHFRSEGQGILISGDTGCVDFKPSGNKPYYQQLLDTLHPLNVIQIAHHGGNNTHFYRVLEQCKGKSELQEAWMLLSHEVRSPYRPNNVFRIFIENIRRTGSGPNLLFTSAPRLAAVSGFEDLIAAPTAQPTDHGDVSLRYDGTGWCVVSHAVDASRLT